MLPILNASRDQAGIEAIKGKLSLRPLLLPPDGDQSAAAKFETVRGILRDVQHRGAEALVEYTEKFDKLKLTPETLRVSQSEIDAAVAAADPAFVKVLDIAIENIRTYQKAMLPPEPKPITPKGGGLLGIKYTPIERVGIYAPGGAAAYPSTVLHCAVPAQVAGVKELVLCSPSREGRISPHVLVAASRVGIKEIYRIGGAQAIAALTFGISGKINIKPVEKIVGPGNTFVQLAKKELYGLVDIDSFAGPSEVIVLADDTAKPYQVAAELLAQAEHAPGSCLLITASEKLACAVQAEVEKQLGEITRQALTREAMKFASAIIVTKDHAAAIALTDEFAPEHLQITTQDAMSDARRVRHAGAIFVGAATPVAAGDYLAGPSHVLPTSGTAHFFSGLSAESFRKRTSLIHYEDAALQEVAQSIDTFARAEGFDAHARSVAARLA